MLGTNLKAAFAKVRGILSPGEIKKIKREFRRALLLADVPQDVVEEFVGKVEQFYWENIPPGISREVHVKRRIFEELVSVFGGKISPPLGPYKIMLVGTQGSGKTTTAVKLAKFFIKRGVGAVVATTDFKRPAAVQQLLQYAKSAGVPVVEGNSVEEIVLSLSGKKGKARILDTAGRSSLDSDMVEELLQIKRLFSPDLTFLVIPAEMGAAAEEHAKNFAEKIGIDGIIITRVDASGRGGGALAACKKIGVPVYFVGTGEKVDEFEPFDAEKFVKRLLGMPDLESILEKAEKIEPEPSERFDINAFYQQLKAFKELGPVRKVLASLGLPESFGDIAEEKFKKYDAIYKSMTKQERAHPEIINASRIRRIARGSGTTEADVREFLRDYERMKKLLKLSKDRRFRMMLRRLRF